MSGRLGLGLPCGGCRAGGALLLGGGYCCACTVVMCWRRLSSRLKFLPQSQWKGRSPVCFLLSITFHTADEPYVPCKVFTPCELHGAVAVARTLEDFI